MHIHQFCLKALYFCAALFSPISLADNIVVLNFSAMVIPGTCSMSVDQPILLLGNVTKSGLKADTLLNAKKFTLSAQKCRGITGGVLAPSITINGNGTTQDGRWLFSSPDSTAGNTGIMLFKSDAMPDYSSSEVKNGEGIPLAGVGEIPANQDLTFFAGVSCGGAGGCSHVEAGTVSAVISFNFEYR